MDSVNSVGEDGWVMYIEPYEGYCTFFEDGEYVGHDDQVDVKDILRWMERRGYARIIEVPDIDALPHG